MKLILKDGNVYKSGKFHKQTVCIADGTVSCLDNYTELDGFSVIDCSMYYIFPGFTDVHVHFREPGFSYKETIKTGSLAAARGGFTDVCTMPNLNPAPDCIDNLQQQLDIIKNDAVINVYPFATITKGQMGEELSDMEDISELSIGYTDDGRGVQSDDVMEAAMRKAKSLGKIISAHCEDNSLLFGGYIHDGEYAKLHGHKGICSESEWKQIERDLKLVEKTGCAYHVCHISTKESVDVIRRAKKAGLDVTCETAPHYLIMNDMMLQEDGRFKMNPPIRSEEDRLALVEGLIDGTIDMIATDHAPHSAEEKSRGLEKSNMGVVGIETSFATMYTYLVKTGIISLEKLIEVMYKNPSERFGIKKDIADGEKANLTVFDLNKKYKIDPEDFKSMGRATPFKDWEVFGECMLTVCNGEIAYDNGMNIIEKK
ncbi:MAG: dihydroorotase [Ruminococcaceae bacterium]|nr:dihydroorotase [Oscillospiraceae bacterium]